jgi:hypothetical protein
MNIRRVVGSMPEDFSSVQPRTKSWPYGLEAPVDENGKGPGKAVWRRLTPEERVQRYEARRKKKYVGFMDDLRLNGVNVENPSGQEDLVTDIIYRHFSGRFPDKQRISCYNGGHLKTLLNGLVRSARHYIEDRNN